MKRIQYRLMVLALRVAKSLAISYAKGTGNPPRNILADAEGDSKYGETRRPQEAIKWRELSESEVSEIWQR